MELGVTSFGDLTPNPFTGETLSPEQRMKNLLEEIVLADQVGLDVFGIGEHHRSDYIVSSPAVVLGAAAAATKRIRLTSAVTVLSSDDPVRVFQQFSTVDLLSGGRAEIIAGRGSFIESFPLFGYDLDDYSELFSEKLDLLLKIRENERVTWSGRHRAAIDDLGVYPRPVQNPLPVWIGVGGTPQSVVRAGKLGLPLIIAIIGGQPARFASLVDLYRQSARQAGHDPSTLPVAINSLGYLADSGAAEEFFPYYAPMIDKIGRERGWPPLTPEAYAASHSPRGALMIGDPQEIIDKILYEHELFDHDRFLLQFSTGTLPHEKNLKAIELFGTVVAPAVRKALGS